MCHFSLAFLHCVFWNVSSNGLHERMHSHTDCICLTFLHCVFSNVSSNGVHKRMQSHTDCICWTFLHCVLSNVSSNRFPKRMQSHIGCICLAFLHYVSSNVYSKCLHIQHNHTGCTCETFLPCLFLSSKPFHRIWFHSTNVVQDFDSSPAENKRCFLCDSHLRLAELWNFGQKSKSENEKCRNHTIIVTVDKKSVFLCPCIRIWW